MIRPKNPSAGFRIRQWVEQSFRQIKGELGFSDFQVRSDHAILRHWELIFCAFSFCWWAYTSTHEATFTDAPPEARPIPEEAGEKRRGRPATLYPVVAGGSTASTRMAGPVGNAVALLEGVVEGAPATTTASAA